MGGVVMTGRRIVAALIGGLLILAGCGDSDDDATGSADTAGAENTTPPDDSAMSDDEMSGGSEIAATATEFAFDPASWTVAAGEFTMTFTNDGNVDHEWAVLVLGGDIETQEEFVDESQVLLEVEAIAAGETVTETFTIAEPGTYQVACLLPGHFDAGMQGTLTVE